MPTKFFRLRWRFEFFNGKAPKIGVWDSNSDLPTDSAWAVNKEGLAKVIVEAENRQTYELKQLLVIDGPDFASMQWEAYTKAPTFGLQAKHGAIKLPAYIAGLSVLTRESKITCWVNGKITQEQLSEHDKLWQIHEHS